MESEVEVDVVKGLKVKGDVKGGPPAALRGASLRERGGHGHGERRLLLPVAFSGPRTSDIGGAPCCCGSAGAFGLPVVPATLRESPRTGGVKSGFFCKYSRVASC